MAYFKRIEPLVEEMQQAIAVAKDISGQPKGVLRMTTSTSFGKKCVVPLLPNFQAKHPELTVELLLTDAVVDLIAERVDVAIRMGLLSDSTLIAQQLMRTDYSVCASPQYLEQCGQPKRPSDLENHNCLLFPLEGFRSRWVFRDRNGNESEIFVQGRTTISNAIALQQCAITGMGLVLLPNWLVDDDLRAGSLINIFPDYDVTATDFSTAAWIIYPSRAYVPLKVRVFIDFLRDNLSTKS